MPSKQNIEFIPDDFTGVIERTFITTEYPSNTISALLVRSRYLNGKLHNEDGPAVTSSDGNKYWFLNDISYSEEEYKQWLTKINLNRKLQSKLEYKNKEAINKI